MNKDRFLQVATKVISFFLMGMAILLFLAAFRSAEPTVMPVIVLMVFFGIILFFVHESTMKLGDDEIEVMQTKRRRSAWGWLIASLIPISMSMVLLPTAFKALLGVDPEPQQQEMPKSNQDSLE